MNDRKPYAWKRVCGRWIKVKSFATVASAKQYVKENPGSIWAYAKPAQV